MTLVLSRSPAQEEALDQLIADQQNPTSPEYHHWLTPEQFGLRFGLSDDDISAITGWLESQQLQVNWISPSRMFINFVGTARDVGRAFGTEVHTYSVNGKPMISVSGDPVIPQSLALAIRSVRGLYTIEYRPLHQVTQPQASAPLMTIGAGSSASYFISPADFNTIYNLPASLTGAGQTIGIVSESRTNFPDFTNFRQQTGTTFSNPIEVVPTAFGGVDPGPAYTSPPSSGSIDLQTEATLDVQRAGSVAQGASLLLVVSSAASGGVSADAQYLVQTSPVPAQVMNISFGSCESSAGPSGVAFWDTLFQQAAVEGISVFVSSGDSGASGCDTAFAAPPSSPAANSTNSICSSSYATCVGGTEFNDAGSPSTYWNAANNTGLLSVLGYIPEGAWNEPDPSGTMQVAASGGGVSVYNTSTPSWQTGTGVPVARAGRYTPDVSFSSSCHDGYFGCMAAAGGSCVAGSGGSYYFVAFCGTSAAAPGMAGVAALLNQKLGVAQGNINKQLYQQAASNPAAFHDATVATSGVNPCSVNTPSMCNNSIPGPASLTSGMAGYALTTGFDEVTGLGSLNVSTFINNYALKATPTVTVSPSPSSIATTQPLSVNVAVSGGSSNPTPTGSVTLISGTYTSSATGLNAGSATITVPAGMLATGTDTLTATYTPDAAGSTSYFGASGSNSVSVAVSSKSTPSVTASPSASSITTAQQLTVTIAVAATSGNPSPTGSVTLTSGSYASAADTLSSGNATITVPAGSLTTGADTLTASYIPDSSSSSTYTPSLGTTSVTVTATVTPAVTVSPSPASITALQSTTVTVTVASGGGHSTPTGSITLSSGSYTSAATVLSAGEATITIAAGTLATGTDTLTASYTPDAASTPYYNTSSGTGSVTVAVKATPAIAVSPSPASITTAQSTSVTITVASASGFSTPTGSITLSSGSYTSSATTLSGGQATIIVPAGSLAIGTATLTASYTPDSASVPYYNSASGNGSITVAAAVITTPTVTVSPSPASISTAQTVAVTITVVPTSGYPTPTGAVTLSSGSYTSAATALSNGTIAITPPAGALSVGTDTLTASYTPDSNSSTIYKSAAGTGSVTVSASAGPSFTITGTNVTVTAGSSSGNTSTITVTPVAGFTGSVSLAAAISGGPVNAVTPPSLSFGTTALGLNGTTAQTATLTVSTTAGSSQPCTASDSTHGKLSWPEGGAALACLLLFGVPARRRYWRALLGMAVLSCILASGLAACTSGNSAGTCASTQTPGTTAGAYTITITGTSNAVTATGTITVTVQ